LCASDCFDLASDSKDRGFLYVGYFDNSAVAWSKVLAQCVSLGQAFGGGLQVGQEDEDQDPLARGVCLPRMLSQGNGCSSWSWR
jgi:hypothetical protein